jgi:hypothetical protein
VRFSAQGTLCVGDEVSGKSTLSVRNQININHQKHHPNNTMKNNKKLAEDFNVDEISTLVHLTVSFIP